MLGVERIEHVVALEGTLEVVENSSTRFRLSFRALVGTRKEVIGQIQVCDTHLRRTNLPKKLSDFFNMSSVLQAELRSACSQSMPYGVLDLKPGEYVEFD